MRRLCALLIVLVAAAPVAAAAVPNDPHFEKQYGLRIVGAPTAWDASRGGGVTVAVVDTGVDLDHPDLAGNLVGGRNFVEDGQPPQDDHGHGTHVAGIVGALTGNGRGVASMAPEVDIMPVRVLEKDEDSNGATGTCADVQAGIRWAADHGADVINLSLGPQFVALDFVLGSCIEGPVQEAWSKGAIPVVAAGNDSLLVSPYENMNAIVVSATDERDAHAPYSNGTTGAKWGMAAPGDQIASTWLDGYMEASGTSMAAPHVAGGAALLRSLPDVSKQQAVDILLETAEDLGPSGEDATYGHGRLDAAAAVASVTGGSGGSGEPAPGPAGTNGSQPEPRPAGGPSSAPSPGGGGSTGEPSPTGRSSDGGSSPEPSDTPGPSATASPERGGVSGAGEGDGGPSPVAAPPTSEGGGLLLPVAGIMGALALSAGGLLLWLRRGGP